MKKHIQTSIESLGSNVLYIQKWPWEFSSDFAWWEYMKRPVPNLDEYKEIRQRSKTAQHIVFVGSTMTSASVGELIIDDAVLMGITEDYPLMQTIDIAEGRFFNETEFHSGINVGICGFKIADELFPGINPINKNIKLFNQKVKIIGVLTEEGQTPFSNSHDNSVIVPVEFYRRIIDIKDANSSNPLIMVKVKPGISNLQASDELTGILRSVRRLKPSAEDNFSINEASLISKGFESLFGILNIAGWFIGSFSLLVGGFGIANIMFVSVSERTRIIGIQKATGAKSYYILLQYLSEAVFLSVIGGAIGLIIVYLLTLLISTGTDFSLFVSTGNVITALGVSALIGIVSGLAPALRAARMDPVEAIRK